MCRLSQKVQDSCSSVQNVQDKRAFVQRRANVFNNLYTAEESCTERYGNMTKQQIYFSGLTRFVHTCLGLICEFECFVFLVLFVLKGPSGKHSSTLAKIDKVIIFVHSGKKCFNLF